MRKRGERIAGRDPALRTYKQGWLVFQRAPLDSYGPEMMAVLLDKEGGKEILRPLRKASIRRVDGAMHIAGYEYFFQGIKSRSEVFKQSWLCTTDPAIGLALVSRIHIKSSTGFSPEDDDY